MPKEAGARPASLQVASSKTAFFGLALLCSTILLWMDKILHNQKKPWNDDSPVKTNKLWDAGFRPSTVLFLMPYASSPTRGEAPMRVAGNSVDATNETFVELAQKLIFKPEAKHIGHDVKFLDPQNCWFAFKPEPERVCSKSTCVDPDWTQLFGTWDGNPANCGHSKWSRFKKGHFSGGLCCPLMS